MTHGRTADTDTTPIRDAVQASREFAAALFDQLRLDGLDEPGVSRDTYGPGNSARTTLARRRRPGWA